jgi:hypothetical protein
LPKNFTWDEVRKLLTVVAAAGNRVHINVGWPLGRKGNARHLHELARSLDAIREISRAAGKTLGVEEVELVVSHTYATYSTRPRLIHSMLFSEFRAPGPAALPRAAYPPAVARTRARLAPHYSKLLELLQKEKYAPLSPAELAEEEGAIRGAYAILAGEGR